VQNPARPAESASGVEQRAWTKLSRPTETMARRGTGAAPAGRVHQKGPCRRDDLRLVAVACPSGRDRLRAESRLRGEMTAIAAGPVVIGPAA
jgi:hypothetical protein